MSASATPTEQTANELHVPMPDVVRFIRQLSHDLRNQLNAAELQSAYLKEIAEDGEVKDEIQRLRAMLSELGSALQRLTGMLAPARLTEMQYEAAAFLEDLRDKVAAAMPEKNGELAWDVNVGDAALNIDPQILQQAMLELITNAFQHERGTGPVRIEGRVNSEFSIALVEPKSNFVGSTEEWGREPFRKVKHGHYGLGLLRARSIIEAHRGRLEARHDAAASSLITTVSLPLAGKS